MTHNADHTHYRIGVYPGTFDPVTKGHLHLIKRAARMVDRLIIGVAENHRKGPLFSLDERQAMVERDILNMGVEGCEIIVKPFDQLLVDFVAEQDATFIFRGLRAVSDFEYEFQMTGMNAKLRPEIETVFLMAADKWQFVSSAFVKEISSMGGDVAEFVTPDVAKALSHKFQK